MDDLVLIGNDPNTCVQFKAYFNDCFHIQDLRLLKYFLGIEVLRNSQRLFFLCQRKYALGSVDECGLLGSKSVDFPKETNHKLALAIGRCSADLTQYRRLAVGLIYLTVKCPKLCCSVHILS